MVKVWHPDRFQIRPEAEACRRRKTEGNQRGARLPAFGAVLCEAPKAAARDSEPLRDPEPLKDAPRRHPRQFSIRRSCRTTRSRRKYGGHEALRKRSISKILSRLWLLPELLPWWGCFGSHSIPFCWRIQKLRLLGESSKPNVSRDIHANGLRLWTNATENVKVPKHENAPAAGPHATQERAPAAQDPAAEVENQR